MSFLRKKKQSWKNPESVGKNRKALERTGKFFGSQFSLSFQPPCTVTFNAKIKPELYLPPKTKTFWKKHLKLMKAKTLQPHNDYFSQNSMQKSDLS